MAASGVFALRYAHAFSSVATSVGLDPRLAQAQMRDFADTLAGSRELREVFTDPSIPSTQKLSVLDAIAVRLGMFREVRNFTALIIENDRLSDIEAILTEVHQLADSGAGLAEAEVISARELNPDDRATLEFEISKLIVSRVSVTYKQDPALLGGAVVKIGSTVYDGSVRAQLDRMKQSLVTP